MFVPTLHAKVLAMHAPLNTEPTQEPAPQRYAIIRLSDGKEMDNRETYWLAMMRAYTIMRMGTFTVEKRN